MRPSNSDRIPIPTDRSLGCIWSAPTRQIESRSLRSGALQIQRHGGSRCDGGRLCNLNGPREAGSWAMALVGCLRLWH